MSEENKVDGQGGLNMVKNKERKRFVVTFMVDASSEEVARRKALRMMKNRDYAHLEWIEPYGQEEQEVQS